MKLWLQNVGTTVPATMLCLEQFPYVIGRRRECQGCLPYAFISRQHCEFTSEEGRVQVKDLESYNGTFVNGRPALTPLPVTDGDEITLGPMSFLVLMPRADAETARSIHTQHDLTQSDSPQPTREQGAARASDADFGPLAQ
jgi:pSer/pThr/pTyr-binding forkhead associated (FHA) protein